MRDRTQKNSMQKCEDALPKAPKGGGDRVILGVSRKDWRRKEKKWKREVGGDREGGKTTALVQLKKRRTPWEQRKLATGTQKKDSLTWKKGLQNRRKKEQREKCEKGGRSSARINL